MSYRSISGYMRHEQSCNSKSTYFSYLFKLLMTFQQHFLTLCL